MAIFLPDHFDMKNIRFFRFIQIVDDEPSLYPGCCPDFPYAIRMRKNIRIFVSTQKYGGKQTDKNHTADPGDFRHLHDRFPIGSGRLNAPA